MGSVTVVGAGIVGICTALYLQREGFAVTLMDRDEPGAGCSSGSAGMIQTGSVMPLGTLDILSRAPSMLFDPKGPLVFRWPHLLRIAPWLIAFVRASAPSHVEKIAADLAALLSRAKSAFKPLLAETGAERLLVNRGELYVMRAQTAYDRFSAKYDLFKRHNVTFEPLGSDALHEFEPALSSSYRYGCYLPDSCFTVCPQRLCSSLAAGFAAAGGKIIRAEATELVLGQHGVRALGTVDGEIPVERLVVAAGAFSSPLAIQLGARVRLTAMRGYHVMVPYEGLALKGPLIDPERAFGVVPMTDGIRLAGTAEFAGLETPPDWRRAEMLLPMARDMVPKLVGRGEKRWMGCRPSTPDSLPVIGQAPAACNAWLAFGHGQLGLTLAAVTGRLVCDGLTGRIPDIDLSPYRPERWN